MNSTSPNKVFVIASLGFSVAAVVLILRGNLGRFRKSAVAESSSSDSILDDKSPPELRVIDVPTFTAIDSICQKWCKEDCEAVANALRDYGIVIVRDQRVSVTDNDAFINMMERYYASSDGIRDARPEYHYQVGVTPSYVERPRNHSSQIAALGPDDKPLSLSLPVHDPKWRFFWRMGPSPKRTKFPLLNMNAVIPSEILEWSEVMDTWGNKMLDTLNTVSEMIALGFNLPIDTFTKKLFCGPHLLAPTGSNYSIHNEVGTVLAGFHYDLNFLTIHGKSRYPGLYVWTKEGKKMAVAVPEGCLLVQAGKQLEYLTGGHIKAGFHEVIISKETRKIINKKTEMGESLWRISSTLFGHIQSDEILQPLPCFANEDSQNQYPPILTGDQVREELQAISLAKS